MVPLQNSPSPNTQTLYAVLHYENPDDGKFTFTPANGADTPVLTDGKVVKAHFRADVATTN